MASQFFGLNIAYTGLQASHAWLTTTANNIANVETEGYSRQQVVQEAGQALRTFQTYGMAGAGVEAKAIEQVRNQFYDLKYWNSNATLGSYEIKESYVKQIEDYFTESDTVPGFGTIYSAMFSGLDEVYKSAGTAATKSQFLYLAGNMCEYFNAMSTNLKKLQEDANLEIKNQVDNINTIAAEIASANKQINAIEINGITANELRDKRAVLIDRLSKIVDVETQEIPIYTQEGGNIESGTNRFIVRIAGGQELVNTYRYNTLECVPREYKVNQSDADGLFDIMWSNHLEFNLYGRNLNGTLKGLVEVRDGNNEEYFHGGVTDTEVNTTTITVNMGQATLPTLPESGSVTLGGRTINYTSYEYDEEKNEYTFLFDGDQTSIKKNMSSIINIGTKAGTVASDSVTEKEDEDDEGITKVTLKLGDEEIKNLAHTGTINFGGTNYTYVNRQWDPVNKQYTFTFNGDTPDVKAGESAVLKVDIEGRVQEDAAVKTTKLTIGDIPDYLKEIEKCTLTQEGIITLTNKEYNFTDWSYDSSTGEYTFIVEENALAFKGQGAQIGKSIQYQGIPYYQEQMNEWVREFANAMNKIEQTAKDADGNPAEVLFGGKKLTDEDMWDFDGDNVNFSSDGDNYYQLTADNFIVNKNMLRDVSKFLTNSDPYQGQDQQDILSELMDVQTNKDKMTFKGCSSKEFLECILTDVALNASNATTFSKNYGNITNSIQNQRLSVMGVDNDEEALNLVKFQEAYNLSAKMISVFQEIYDKLINQTGV